MRSSLYYGAFLLLALAACQSGVVRETPNAAAAAETYTATADSTVFANDITSLNSASRKRIRTADVRCRVGNVFQAVTTLEHAVNTMGGIVTESSLQNEYGMSQDIPYSADSLKQVRMYTPTATLTLRVPAARLDSVVHTLTSLAAFIDYRTLKEEDRTLDYLSNALKNNEPGAFVGKRSKSPMVPDMIKYQDSLRENAIDRKIINLSIMDEVNYATLSVQLFQPQLADIQIVPNADHISRAGFGTEILASLRGGLNICRNILLGLVWCWPFVLGAVAAWAGYRKWRA